MISFLSITEEALFTLQEVLLLKENINCMQNFNGTLLHD